MRKKNNKRNLGMGLGRTVFKCLKLFLAFSFLAFSNTAFSAFHEVNAQLYNNGEVYQIPIGEPYVDEYGDTVYTLVDKDDFYIEQNGNLVFPEAGDAAKLFAMSQALSYIASYPYQDAIDVIQDVSDLARSELSNLTESQKQLVRDSETASLVSGVAGSFVVGAAICATSFVTGAGAIVGCAFGATATVVLLPISIADAIATAYSENQTLIENVTLAQRYIISADEVFDEARAEIVVAEYMSQFVGATPSYIYKYLDVSSAYRELGLGVAKLEDAAGLYASANIDVSSAEERLSKATIFGFYPGISTLNALYTAGFKNESEFTEWIYQESSSAAENDVFYKDNIDTNIEFFANKWGMSYQLLHVLKMAINVKPTSVSRGIKVYTTTGNIEASDIDSFLFDFGDGNVQINRKSDFHAVKPTAEYVYSQDGNYTVTVTLIAIDGRQVQSSMDVDIVSSTVNPVDNEYAPYASRKSPSLSMTAAVGSIVRFRVKGRDSDGNLSHVIWSANGPASYIENNDRDNFNDGEEGYESMEFSIDALNGGEKIEIIATVFDDIGNSDSVSWYVDPYQTFSPVLTAVSHPDSTPIEIPLGDLDVDINISDSDDNTHQLNWYLDGSLVEEDSVNGGVPTDLEGVHLSFSEAGQHELVAKATDDDGLKAEIRWDVFVGGGGTTPPFITEFGPSDRDLPYTQFRVGKSYEFICAGKDIDDGDGIFSIEMKLDGSQIYYWEAGTPEPEKTKYDDIVFGTIGESLLECLVKDTGGNTTTEQLAIDILSKDGTAGTAPTLTIFPTNSTLYASSSIMLRLAVSDPEFDADGVEVYIDGSLHTAQFTNGYEDGLFSQESHNELEITDLPASGSHTLELVPVDLSGNKGTGVSKTLVIGSGNRSPVIQKVLPGPSSDLDVATGVNIDFHVYAEDPDGDLDEIIVDRSGVTGVSNDIKTQGLGGMYTYGGDLVTVLPIQDGVVTITAKDVNGNTSSVLTYNVTVSASNQNRSPEILNFNLSDGSTYLMKPTGRINVEMDAFDPDADLSQWELYIDGSLEYTGSTALNNLNRSRYSTDPGVVLDSRNMGFNFPQDRGQQKHIVYQVIDSQGNETQKEFYVKLAPVDELNHSPVADSTLNLNVDQRETLEFSVSIIDEEGDVSTPTITNMSNEGRVEYLGDYTFIYIPNHSFYGTETFDIEWEDGFGGSATTSVSVGVTQVILPPVLSQTSLDSIILLGDSYDLGEDLASMAYSEGYDISALIFAVDSSENVVITGDELGGASSITVELASNQTAGSLTGYVEDPDGKQSNLFTLAITGVDTVAPVITPPADIQLGSPGATGVPDSDSSIQTFLNGASASDAVDGSISEVYYIAPALFEFGANEVTFFAYDEAGNKGEATAAVTIVDTGDPQLTVPSDSEIVISQGNTLSTSNSQVLAFLNAASATDNLDASPDITTDISATISLGGTLVEFTATDDAGNQTSDSATITLTSLDNDSDGMSNDFEDASGLDKNNPSDAALDPDGDGETNLEESQRGGDITLDDVPPVVTPSADVVLNLDAAEFDLVLTPATAIDAKDGVVSTWSSGTPATSGSHLVTWYASDTAGNVGSATQLVELYPIVEFKFNETLFAEGATAEVIVKLSGPSPEYPIQVPIFVTNDGDATNGVDFNAVNQVIEIAESADPVDQAVYSFELIDDGVTGETDETIVLKIDATERPYVGEFESPVRLINPAEDFVTTVIVTESNMAPSLDISFKQDGVAVNSVEIGSGSVNVDLTIDDPNPNDTHSIRWYLDEEEQVNFSNEKKVQININDLEVGTYKVRVEVTDSGEPSISTSIEGTLKVTETEVTGSSSATGGGGGGSLDEVLLFFLLTLVGSGFYFRPSKIPMQI